MSSWTARDPQRPSLQQSWVFGALSQPLGEQCLPRVLGEMEPRAQGRAALYFRALTLSCG